MGRYLRRRRRATLAVIDKAAQAAGVPFEGLTVAGEYPAETILEVARKRRCDLFVMASHGRGGLLAVLLGSATLKVLTGAQVAVMVCR